MALRRLVQICKNELALNKHMKCINPLSVRLNRLSPIIQQQSINHASSSSCDKDDQHGASSHASPIRLRENITDRSFDTQEEFEKKSEQIVKQENHDLFAEQDFDGRIFETITVDKYRQIIEEAGDSETEEKINIIINEYEYEKYTSNGKMPITISEEDMKEILLTEPFNSNQILKYLKFLFSKEMAKRRNKRVSFARKEEKKRQNAERFEKLERQVSDQRTGIVDQSNGRINYGLWHNSLNIRISNSTIKSNQSIRRLMQAAIFGPKLIFDFSYDDYMSRQEMRNLGDQLRLCYSVNRYDFMEPFDFWFCNFDPSTSFSAQQTVSRTPSYVNAMISSTSKCYTDVFPRERLIYLSPHAKKSLDNYSEDDIFIVGAMNDNIGPHTHLSNVFASSKGVRCYKLPLDEHVCWDKGTKSLCLNHVVGILLEHRQTRDWKYSLEKHLPSRKLKSIETIIEENEKRRMKIKRPKRMIYDRKELYDTIFNNLNKSKKL